MSVIELKKVSKQFKIGDEVQEILKPTDLVINKSEFNAIVGPSGSGKSTLLTIIGALQKPSSGDIYINNQNLVEFNQKELSKLRFSEIGFILQASNLVPYLTVKEQFELKYTVVGKKVNQQRIDGLLDELSISHLKNKYPEDISGGERQRVAIGLALVNEPKVILADEPTASLDTNRSFEVIDIFKRISKESQTTIIMVTHDVRMLDECDRVFEMKDGVLEEKKIKVT
jgi:putative ABC transport system ATP-binding protein